MVFFAAHQALATVFFSADACLSHQLAQTSSLLSEAVAQVGGRMLYDDLEHHNFDTYVFRMPSLTAVSFPWRAGQSYIERWTERSRELKGNHVLRCNGSTCQTTSTLTSDAMAPPARRPQFSPRMQWLHLPDDLNFHLEVLLTWYLFKYLYFTHIEKIYTYVYSIYIVCIYIYTYILVCTTNHTYHSTPLKLLLQR